MLMIFHKSPKRKRIGLQPFPFKFQLQFVLTACSFIEVIQIMHRDRDVFEFLSVDPHFCRN
jgi:hypothetical protein